MPATTSGGKKHPTRGSHSGMSQATEASSQIDNCCFEINYDDDYVLKANHWGIDQTGGMEGDFPPHPPSIRTPARHHCAVSFTSIVIATAN